MEPERKELNLDDFLDDLREILDGMPVPDAEDEIPAETPAEKPAERPVDWSQTQRVPRHVAKLQKHQAEAYETWQREQGDLEEAAAGKHLWTETQKLPRHVAKLQNNQADAYDKWLRQQQDNPPPPPPAEDDPIPAPKKGHGLRNFLIFLLVFIVSLSAVIVFALPDQPEASVGGMGDRQKGVATLLLAGLDSSGSRADAVMLLTLDSSRHTIRLVSIPRDTLVHGTDPAPRLSGVYGRSGGGKIGTQALMDEVTRLVGFRPDGYVVMGMPALQAAVDALGGVEFDVPMDMSYTDPTQNLVIDLQAGLQTLDGESALELLRYRDGYSDADLGRVKTQRAFLTALIRQTATAKGLLKTPALLQIFRKQVQTDLTAANWLWLARTTLLADTVKVNSATLPGNGTYIDGVNCYVLDAELTAAMISTYSSPYKRDIAPENLQIPTK